MRREFEKELTKQGFLFQKTSDGYYNITPRNRILLPSKVQLVISKRVNPIYHGSQNGHDIDAIGLFHFGLNSEPLPEYMVFSFQHMGNVSTEYMIITTNELRSRLKKNIIRYRRGDNLELRLWLMEGDLYDSTSMSLEGEWYYLSKGTKGNRMIYGTIWNYTSFRNNWVLGSQD